MTAKGTLTIIRISINHINWTPRFTRGTQRPMCNVAGSYRIVGYTYRVSKRLGFIGWHDVG
jgi:hypothetical protein